MNDRLFLLFLRRVLIQGFNALSEDCNSTTYCITVKKSKPEKCLVLSCNLQKILLMGQKDLGYIYINPDTFENCIFVSKRSLSPLVHFLKIYHPHRKCRKTLYSPCCACVKPHKKVTETIQTYIFTQFFWQFTDVSRSHSTHDYMLDLKCNCSQVLL